MMEEGDGPYNSPLWIDYEKVWDVNAQNYFLEQWWEHCESLKLNPKTQRDLCLSLIFKWHNRIPGDD